MYSWGPDKVGIFEACVVPSDLASLLSGQGFHGLGRPPESLGWVDTVTRADLSNVWSCQEGPKWQCPKADMEWGLSTWLADQPTASVQVSPRPTPGSPSETQP